MKSLFKPGKEVARHERAISSLHVRIGAPLVEVRRPFAQEFSRLELGAKVRSYLAALTVSRCVQPCGGKAPCEATLRGAKAQGASR
jgi:hypothetical protein